MKQENISSTASKLLQHPERFQEWREGNYRPMSLQLAPTDACNLHCSFCSVQERSGDSLPFGAVLTALRDLAALGLQTVELTGGGEPLLYEGFDEVVVQAQKLKLKLGLITNGLLLTKKSCLGAFDWVRVSLNGLDQRKGPNIPGNLHEVTTLGFSYVVEHPLTYDREAALLSYLHNSNARYLRLVPNCLSTEAMEQSTDWILQSRLLADARVVAQVKVTTVPATCCIGYLKPFLAPDGYFYPCSAIPLLERRFPASFRLGRWDQVKLIWGNPKPLTTERCEKCFFCEHNTLLESLQQRVLHPAFL